MTANFKYFKTETGAFEYSMHKDGYPKTYKTKKTSTAVCE